MVVAIILLAFVMLLAFAGLYKGIENQNVHIQAVETSLNSLLTILQSFGGDKS